MISCMDCIVPIFERYIVMYALNIVLRFIMASMFKCIVHFDHTDPDNLNFLFSLSPLLLIFLCQTPAFSSMCLCVLCGVCVCACVILCIYMKPKVYKWAKTFDNFFSDNFLTAIDFFFCESHHIMNPNPTHFSFSPYLPFTLATSSQRKEPNNERNNIWPWKLQCLYASSNISLCPNSVTYRCSLQWVIALVWGSEFCSTISTGSSLSFLSDMLLLLCVMEIRSFRSAGPALAL